MAQRIAVAYCFAPPRIKHVLEMYILRNLPFQAVYVSYGKQFDVKGSKF